MKLKMSSYCSGAGRKDDMFPSETAFPKSILTQSRGNSISITPLNHDSGTGSVFASLIGIGSSNIDFNGSLHLQGDEQRRLSTSPSHTNLYFMPELSASPRVSVDKDDGENMVEIETKESTCKANNNEGDSFNNSHDQRRDQTNQLVTPYYDWLQENHDLRNKTNNNDHHHDNSQNRSITNESQYDANAFVDETSSIGVPQPVFSSVSTKSEQATSGFGSRDSLDTAEARKQHQKQQEQCVHNDQENNKINNNNISYKINNNINNNDNETDSSNALVVVHATISKAGDKTIIVEAYQDLTEVKDTKTENINWLRSDESKDNSQRPVSNTSGASSSTSTGFLLSLPQSSCDLQRETTAETNSTATTDCESCYSSDFSGNYSTKNCASCIGFKMQQDSCWFRNRNSCIMKHLCWCSTADGRHSKRKLMLLACAGLVLSLCALVFGALVNFFYYKSVI